MNTPQGQPGATPHLRDAAQQHRYELMQDGELAGFIDYRDAEGVRHLVHTEVMPQFEGSGFGKQLVRFALDDARQQGRKVVPSCSFVAAYVERHPEAADLVSS